MKLKLHISPCPNDTFIFDAMLNGRIDTEGMSFEVTFADIEELNRGVLVGDAVDVSKVSYAILPEVMDRYLVLDSGSALGRGNGPLLVSRGEVNLLDGSLRVAIPGMHTTAKRLINTLYPHLTNLTSVLFSQIAQRVSDGDFDAGVLIHEGRFTYAERGLRLVADLGVEWERTTSSPLPLGGIVAARRLPEELLIRINRVIRRSVEFAMANPDVSADFVREHAQELSESVRRSHIELFVNEYSLSLGDEGRRAVALLTGLDESEDIFVKP